jgi:hypothetical protein
LSTAMKKIKVKSKAVPVLKQSSTMTWRHMASGCTEPRLLEVGISWRSVVSFTHQPLCFGTHCTEAWVLPKADLKGLEIRKFLLRLQPVMPLHWLTKGFGFREMLGNAQLRGLVPCILGLMCVYNSEQGIDESRSNKQSQRMQGGSKRALQWYSKCCCVATVKKTFTLKSV